MKLKRNFIFNMVWNKWMWVNNITIVWNIWEFIFWYLVKHVTLNNWRYIYIYIYIKIFLYTKNPTGVSRDLTISLITFYFDSRIFEKTPIFYGLVMISTTCSWVEYCVSSATPSLTRSRRKWKRISMCLLRPCIIGFFESLMADMLSQYTTVGPDNTWVRLFRILLNQTT